MATAFKLSQSLIITMVRKRAGAVWVDSSQQSDTGEKSPSASASARRAGVLAVEPVLRPRWRVKDMKLFLDLYVHLSSHCSTAFRSFMGN